MRYLILTILCSVFIGKNLDIYNDKNRNTLLLQYRALAEVLNK